MNLLYTVQGSCWLHYDYNFYEADLYGYGLYSEFTAIGFRLIKKIIL